MVILELVLDLLWGGGKSAMASVHGMLQEKIAVKNLGKE